MGTGVNWHAMSLDTLDGDINGGSGHQSTIAAGDMWQAVATELQAAADEVRAIVASTSVAWQGVAADSMVNSHNQFDDWAQRAQELSNQATGANQVQSSSFVTARNTIEPAADGGPEPDNFVERGFGFLPGVTTDRESFEAAEREKQRRAAEAMVSYEQTVYSDAQRSYFTTPPTLAVSVGDAPPTRPASVAPTSPIDPGMNGGSLSGDGTRAGGMSGGGDRESGPVSSYGPSSAYSGASSPAADGHAPYQYEHANPAVAPAASYPVGEQAFGPSTGYQGSPTYQGDPTRWPNHGAPTQVSAQGVDLAPSAAGGPGPGAGGSGSYGSGGAGGPGFSGTAGTAGGGPGANGGPSAYGPAAAGSGGYGPGPSGPGTYGPGGVGAVPGGSGRGATGGGAARGGPGYAGAGSGRSPVAGRGVPGGGPGAGRGLPGRGAAGSSGGYGGAGSSGAGGSGARPGGFGAGYGTAGGIGPGAGVGAGGPGSGAGLGAGGAGPAAVGGPSAGSSNAAGRGGVGGPMMGAGAGRRGEDDVEHETPDYLKNFEYFEDGRLVAPPVIGAD